MYLSETARFAVWGPEKLPLPMAVMESPYRDSGPPVLLATGKPTSLYDLARVSECNAEVVLDAGSLEKIEASLKGVVEVTDGSQMPHHASLGSQWRSLPVSLSRAGLFARLVSLMTGRLGVRSQVMELITSMLNSKVVPLFTSDRDAGRQLVQCITGLDTDDAPMLSTPLGDLDLDNAFGTFQLAHVSLTKIEMDTLIQGQFLVTGACCLVSVGCGHLVKALDGVSALSCEGFGVTLDPFDAERFDVCRPHRGQMLSASNLRILLEASKRHNVTSGNRFSRASLRRAFDTIPQMHGPVCDAIATALKSLELDLNCSDIGPNSTECLGDSDSTQAQLALQTITAALSVATQASLKRASALFSNVEGPVRADFRKSIVSEMHISEGVDFKLFEGTNDIVKALACLEKLIWVLSGELITSLNVLGVSEGGANVDLQSTSASLESATETMQRDGQPKKDERRVAVNDDPNWTPEQRAKAEAKRKAKEEKAAFKATEKADRKKSTNAVNLLGTGTTELVAFILSRCKTLQFSTSLPWLLDPFNFSSSSLPEFCALLIDRLNSGGKRKPKIPKGTRDYTPEQMRIREQVFSTIRRVFKRHGGVELDTPVFELKEVLTGKYGEDSKLIYDLADQGGELLSLRYDLTVPFARFLAMNSVGNIKRFHVAKVYRRDQPQLARGRYREFYQCDFDVAGSYSSMVPDAEVITVAKEILTELPVGNFIIKLNHRRLLDAIFDICGVPAEKFRPICSAVDKLDKAPWSEIRLEMVNDKGLPDIVADRIGTFVCHRGEPVELWDKLIRSQAFGLHEGALAAMGDLRILFGYLNAMGSLPCVSFDLSLARGLDYYTGVIYEVVIVDGASQVGSIAAGGRYDNLVGMFSPSGTQTPCVGVSIGIERVFTIMEKKAEELKLNQSPVIQVYIASIGTDTITHRMTLASRLWAADIPTEYSHKDNPKLKSQLDEVLERGVPFMLVFGKDEMTKGTVQIKNMLQRTEKVVPEGDIVEELLQQGCCAIVKAERGFLEALGKYATA